MIIKHSDEYNNGVKSRSKHSKKMINPKKKNMLILQQKISDNSLSSTRERISQKLNDRVNTK